MGMVSEYTFPQVYLKDEWAKRHPLFDGLPCGGLMDYTFYREIIPDWRYWGQDLPEEAVAGAFRNSAMGMPLGTDALGVPPRGRPLHSQFSAGATGIGTRPHRGAPVAEHAPLRRARCASDKRVHRTNGSELFSAPKSQMNEEKEFLTPFSPLRRRRMRQGGKGWQREKEAVIDQKVERPIDVPLLSLL